MEERGDVDFHYREAIKEVSCWEDRRFARAISRSFAASVFLIMLAKFFLL